MTRLDSTVVLNFIYHVFYHVNCFPVRSIYVTAALQEKRAVCLRAHGAELLPARGSVGSSKNHTLNYTSVKHFGSHSLLDL